MFIVKNIVNITYVKKCKTHLCLTGYAGKHPINTNHICRKSRTLAMDIVTKTD